MTAPRPARRLAALLLLAAALAGAALAGAQTAAPEPARTLAEVPVFRMPALNRQLIAVRERIAAGDAFGAEAELLGAIARAPGLADLHFALAQLRARRGAWDEAAASLKRAAELGRRDWLGSTAGMAVFAPMRGREDFAEALAALAAEAPEPRPPRPPAVPAAIGERGAVVEASNAEWSAQEAVVRALFAPLPPAPDLPGLVMTGGSEMARTLNRWHATGEAAGNRGDLYENRDGDHSPLDLRRFPQLTAVEHGEAARNEGFDKGAAEGLAISLGAEEFPPLLGNSSTARTGGPFWRSMGRVGLTEPGRPEELARQYASNQIYVYPEHRDHDPFFGDVFPANTPYQIVSQGSSYSDRVAMESVAMILAALRPETKAKLIETRLIAPTVQMIWRRGQRGIETDADYLSGVAHPTVFDPGAAEPPRMIARAHALTPDEIPPVVRLRVLQEDRPVPRVTVFGDGLTERLFDTPSAIARIHRRTDRELRLTVGAAETEDPNGRPLSFRWVLLRGDPEKVRITPLGTAGEAAEIVVGWHEGVEVPGGSGLRSQRVDIGVFADNGAQLSAPAFVSVAFPPRERRAYDAAGRAEMVDYDSVARQDEYADPLLFPERLWRDVYSWDREGRLLGWTRTGEGAGPSQVARLTRHGAEVREADAEGRAALAERLAYPVGRIADGRSRVVVVPSGQFLRYDYAGPGDRLGEARPAPPPADAAAAPAGAPSGETP